MDPNSLSFIRFQCILHNSGVIFSKSWNFWKLRRWDIIFRGTQFSKNSELFGLPLLYFNFKSSKYLIYSSFIRFQCILQDSGVLESWSIYKLKRRDVISGGNKFWRKSELFDPPFFIPIFKVLCTQINRHSIDLSAFCMIQEYFSHILAISTN